MRNGDFLRLMPDVTQRVLTLQPRQLENAGLIARTVHPVVPPRVDYALTPPGRSLGPILHPMESWGLDYPARKRSKTLVGGAEGKPER